MTPVRSRAPAPARIRVWLAIGFREVENNSKSWALPPLELSFEAENIFDFFSFFSNLQSLELYNENTFLKK